MRGKITEKRIYELLGVNLFRKYILGGYQALFNKIFFITGLTKRYGLKDMYKMRNFSTEGLKSYKKWSKVYAIEHICSFIIQGTVLVLKTPRTFLICWLSLAMIIDVYATMTQRYHHIRINKILEKMNKKDNNNTENIMEIDNQEVSMKKKNITSYAEEKSLSLEERKKELENLRNIVITTTSSHNEEQIISKEKSYAKTLWNTRTKF